MLVVFVSSFSSVASKFFARTSSMIRTKHELRMNTMCCFKQTLETTPNKTAVIQSPPVHRKKNAGRCGEVETDSYAMLSYQFLTSGHAIVTGPAKSYIRQLCVDTGCSLEDLPKAIDVGDVWQKKERDKCMFLRACV